MQNVEPGRGKPNQLLSDRQLVAPGSVYTVRERSGVAVIFVPGVYGYLQENAEVKITQNELSKDGNETDFHAVNERSVQVELTRGKAVFLLPPGDQAAHLKVVTPLATLTASPGALFWMEARGDLLHLTCVRGSVEVGGPSSSGAGTVEEGECLEISPRAQQKTLNYLSATAQDEVLATIEVSESLRRTIRIRQSASAPWRKIL